MPAAAQPVLFVHGLWLHASSWSGWIETFRDAGYEPAAPGWPGDPDSVEESRHHPERFAGVGIDDVVDHFAGLIRRLESPPVLVGHSLGGLVVEKLLARGLGAAGIAIAAAPARGVLYLPPSALRAVFPVLRNPANRHRAVSLTEDQFRYAFANAVLESESIDLYRRWAIPAPGRPLFQLALANVSPRTEAAVDTRASARGPLLLVAGGRDHTVPETVTTSMLARHRRSPALTNLIVFPDRGHSLTVDSGWQAVAEAATTWLRRIGL